LPGRRAAQAEALGLGDLFLGRSAKRHHAASGDDFEEPRLVSRPHIAAVNADGDRPIGWRLFVGLIGLVLEHAERALVSQLVLHPLGRGLEVAANRLVVRPSIHRQ
jgi:hypothetical protein